MESLAAQTGQSIKRSRNALEMRVHVFMCARACACDLVIVSVSVSVFLRASLCSWLCRFSSECQRHMNLTQVSMRMRGDAASGHIIFNIFAADPGAK